MKKFIFGFLFFVILGSSAQTHATSKNKETYKYLDLFGKIFDRVRSKYVDEVTDKELIEKAIDGMLTGLDPHSGYMDEEVWKEMQMDTQGKFGGLGIEITMEEGFVKVIAEEKTDKVLGVSMISAVAGTMIAELALAMEFGASAEDIARTCHAHPTHSEAIKEAAMAVDKRPIHF